MAKIVNKGEGIVMDYEIRQMYAEDWKEVRDIYIEGILTGNATFESVAPSWELWDYNHAKECRFVATDGDTVIGWAALSPVSSRCAYNGVAEVSVYLSPNYRGKGIAIILLEALIQGSEQNGFWTLQAGIFPENIASLSAHKKSGFREIGTRKKVGKMSNGTWRDVVLVERRSESVGIVVDVISTDR